MILSGEITQFYTYRTALVHHSLIIELDEAEIKQLKRYIERNSYQMDNHIAWKNDKGLYFGYSDHKLYVGHKVTEGIY